MFVFLKRKAIWLRIVRKLMDKLYLGQDRHGILCVLMSSPMVRVPLPLGEVTLIYCWSPMKELSQEAFSVLQPVLADSLEIVDKP